MSISIISSRLSWEEYALRLAEVAASRSEDPFCRVGAVALRGDHSVISVGFNGAPPGIEINWSDRDERRKRVCHAESACLRYCKPFEVKLLAVTLCPCTTCMKECGIYKVPLIIYREEYSRDDFSKELAIEFGIELRKVNYS